MKHILKTYICPFLLEYEGFLTVTWRLYILINDAKNSHCKGFSVPEICAKMVPKHWFSIRHATILKKPNYLYIWFIKIRGLGFTGINIEVCGTADINFYSIGFKHFVLVSINGRLTSGQKFFVPILQLSTKCEIMSRKQKMQMQNIIPFPSLFLILHILFPSLHTANTLIWRYIATPYELSFLLLTYSLLLPTVLIAGKSLIYV